MNHGTSIHDVPWRGTSTRERQKNAVHLPSRRSSPRLQEVWDEGPPSTLHRTSCIKTQTKNRTRASSGMAIDPKRPFFHKKAPPVSSRLLREGPPFFCYADKHSTPGRMAVFTYFKTRSASPSAEGPPAHMLAVPSNPRWDTVDPPLLQDALRLSPIAKGPRSFRYAEPPPSLSSRSYTHFKAHQTLLIGYPITPTQATTPYRITIPPRGDKVPSPTALPLPRPPLPPPEPSQRRRRTKCSRSPHTHRT